MYIIFQNSVTTGRKDRTTDLILSPKFDNKDYELLGLRMHLDWVNGYRIHGYIDRGKFVVNLAC